MKLLQGSAENLRCLGVWKTIRALAAERHLLGVSIRDRIVSLEAAGLLETRMVPNTSRKPSAPHTIREYKRTPAGDVALAEFDLAQANTPKKVRAAQPIAPARSGNNPFEWRTYAQPVVLPHDQYTKMHKPDTANSRLHNYSL